MNILRLALAALLAVPLICENETTQLLKYDGSGNLEYVCRARPNQPLYTWTVAGETLTSIVDSSNTATVTTPADHGLAIGNKVTVAGATDADLNATYLVATIPTTKTFTITTANVTDATYTTGVSVSTRAPRSNAAIWSIERYQYSGTSMISAQFPVSATQNLALPNAIFSCDDRATFEYR